MVLPWRWKPSSRRAHELPRKTQNERGIMNNAYVHGYAPQERERLQDQAGTLASLLHADTAYPAGSMVLEAGCGVGAQTVTLARTSPGALFTAGGGGARVYLRCGRDNVEVETDTAVRCRVRGKALQGVD